MIDRSKHTRVQIDMPPSSMARLLALKERTEAPSYGEVIKNALRLYEAMVADQAAGRELLIKEPNGSMYPYRIFAP